MSAIKPNNPNSLVRKTGSIILNILGLVVGIVAIMSIWFNQGTTQNKENPEPENKQVQQILDLELSNEQLLDSCACWRMES